MAWALCSGGCPFSLSSLSSLRTLRMYKAVRCRELRRVDSPKCSNCKQARKRSVCSSRLLQHGRTASRRVKQRLWHRLQQTSDFNSLHITIHANAHHPRRKEGFQKVQKESSLQPSAQRRRSRLHFFQVRFPGVNMYLPGLLLRK